MKPPPNVLLKFLPREGGLSSSLGGRSIPKLLSCPLVVPLPTVPTKAVPTVIRKENWND